MGAWMDKLRGLGGGRAFAAVDFDSRQLRVVLAERAGGRTRVLKLASVAMPEGIDPEAPGEMLAGLLARTLKDLGMGGLGVLMNLPRSQAVLKPLSLPPGTPDSELPGMVLFQVEKELPFHPEEAVVDFTVERQHYDASGETAEAAAGIDVLVAATRLPVVNRCRELASAAGLRLLRLGLRPYANLRCIDACTLRGAKESLLLVHVTAEETEIDVIVGSSLAFSRSVTVKVPSPRAAREERDACVASLATEVARSVQSYQAVQRGGRVDAALVAGGAGLEGPLAEDIARRLGVPCELFDPSGALRLGDVANASAFISALGLAIAHRDGSGLPFDFLCPKRPGPRRDVRKMAKVGAAAAAGVLLAAGIALGVMSLGAKAEQLAALNGQYAKAHAAGVKLRKAVDRVRRVEQWAGEGRDWLSHWAYLSALMPSCTDAYVLSVKTHADGAVSFTVRARESKIITDLGTRLTEAGYKFEPGRLATVNDPYGCTYAADVRVEPTGQVKLDLASVRPVPRPPDDDSLNQWMKTPGASPAAPATPSPTAPARPPTASPSYARRYGYGRPPTAAPAPAPAEAPAAPDGEAVARLRQEILAEFDRDQDGKLSSEEYSRARSVIYGKAMGFFDTNHNGQIDSSERGPFDAFRAALRGGEWGGHRR